jgi:hypothetical protein
VLDDDDGVPGVHQPLETTQKSRDVVHVEPDRWLIKQIKDMLVPLVDLSGVHRPRDLAYSG